MCVIICAANLRKDFFNHIMIGLKLMMHNSHGFNTDSQILKEICFNILSDL